MSDLCTNPRVTCDGLIIGRCRVPSFEARAGELIKVEFPHDRVAEQRELLSLLSARHPRGPIRVAGKVVVVEKPRSRWEFVEMFHRQTALEWLCKRTGLPQEEAMPWLQADRCPWLERSRVTPDAPIAYMAGTPRKLMGVQAAFAMRADVVLFDTEGLDPLGIRDTLTAVAAQLGNSSAIYLTWVGDIEVPEVPFSAVYAVHEHEIQPTASS
jgi:hypothetical protein